jgi:hypothetical protein
MFTPRYCGYVRHTLGQEDFRFKLDDGYDETYAPTSTGRSEGAEGITLGTAMAVSGAALSPNSGSYSSRGTAFFMTLFDVRLGLWMGNTWKEKDKKWRSYGPGWGISYLLSELFGQSDQFKSFVYLSDGGHFEDLGVYELLKRRCKVIVACDVSCDPEYEFDALLRLIEAARTDFNARIEIKTDSIQPNSGQSEDSVVEGTIFYDPRDERDGKNAGEVGKLIYIKACTSKDLPNDVRRYAKLHASFPQQSTADQWFDEDQFESYRALGECIGKAAVRRIEKSIEDVQSSTRVEYFDYVV